MRKKGLIVLLIIFISFLLLVYIFSKPAFNYLSSYLSKSEQVNANILIVEGWLPEYALDMAFKEYKKNDYEYIITTGLEYFNEYFMLSENGYLIFHPDINNSVNNEVRQHIITVNACGSLGGAYSAHFNLFVNNLLIGDFYADKHKRRFSGKWNGSLSEIDTITVQFTNDKADKYGDINLFIKEIVIDSKLTIPYFNNSEFDMFCGEGKKRIINNFNSVAESARIRLLCMGIDSAKVSAVPSEMANINRTLASALSFREWLKETTINIRGINIISMGTHARRTWMTYNKILDEKYDIGIISVPDHLNGYSKEIKVLKTLRETLGIIYYWFILIPY